MLSGEKRSSIQAVKMDSAALGALLVCLLLGQLADDGQLESLSVEGLDEHNNPDDQESQAYQRPHEQSEPAEERYSPDDHHSNMNSNIGNRQKDGLPGVESDIGVSVKRFDDEENNGRNDRDISEPACGVVRKSGLVYG